MADPSRKPLWLLLIFFCCLPAGAEPPALLDGQAAAVYVFPAPHLLSDGTPLLHTFKIRNNTKKTVIIVRVAASCDCIQAQIGSTPLLPVPVPVGTTVPVTVRLSPHRLLPGPFSKSVWLYWPNGSRDGLRLELRGTVQDETAPPRAASVAIHGEIIAFETITLRQRPRAGKTRQ